MSLYVAGTVFGGFLDGSLRRPDRAAPRLALRFSGPRPAGLLRQTLTQRLLRRRSRRRVARQASRCGPLARAICATPPGRHLCIGFCLLFTLVSVFSYITFYLAARALPPETAAAQLAALRLSLRTRRNRCRGHFLPASVFVMGCSPPSRSVSPASPYPHPLAARCRRWPGYVAPGSSSRRPAPTASCATPPPPAPASPAAGMYICSYSSIGGKPPGGPSSPASFFSGRLAPFFAPWPGCAACITISFPARPRRIHPPGSAWPAALGPAPVVPP